MSLCSVTLQCYSAVLFCNVIRASLCLVFFALLGQAQPPHIIIDTDAGSDDILAIAYLLSQPSVHVDAITIANGLAHVDAGARNLAKVVEVSGRPNVSVFAGRPTPLKGSAEFPREWRKLADELPGVTLPTSSRPPSPKAAADYLIEHLKDKKHVVRILALGPLTNLAEALQREPSIAQSVQQIVIMGGAIQVPGNLGDGGAFQTNNKTAEWNIFVDPLAARIVFRSHIPILLVPLDATNKVPIDLAFLSEFKTRVASPLGRVAAQVLEADRESIEGKYFFAWDPLAAVALLHPDVIRSNRLHIDVLQDSHVEGRTAPTPGNPNADVAMDANAARFRGIFLEAFKK
jgi:inosine-uridine nucleoside N-ribohydrolase